jgi:isocitrate dehydrogenase
MGNAHKIKVKTPVVEIDGDEMTRVIWQMVKQRLINPYLEMRTAYYDLHVQNRDATDDRVTVEAARAIMRYGVGIKCATITPNAERVVEYGLKKMWPSPNATIRSMLDGTVFRTPILVKNIRPIVSTWQKPIVIGRHAYGDVYSAAEMSVAGPGRAELLFSPADGSEPERLTVHTFDGPGVLQGMHNTDASMRAFASACCRFALDRKIDLWFSTKDTISKHYDGHFRDVFTQEYREHWQRHFEAAGIQYFFTLIDDAVARVIRSEGGMLWALKNYDGDVMSDMVAAACGSLAMMTSVLVSPQGFYEYEAAHGTVQKHYYRHLRGEATSTNSMALIFAWSGGLHKRGEIDGNQDLTRFAAALEQAAIATIESGIMTADLLRVAEPGPANRSVSTAGFIDAIAERLQQKL